MNKKDQIFEAIVIGKGLMGSAAFRYLTRCHPETLLIGPDEPLEPQTHKGIFSSHYDQGRIVQILTEYDVWSELGWRSARKFKDLEKQSGVSFFSPVGCLVVDCYPRETPDEDPHDVAKAFAQRHQLFSQQWEQKAIHEAFPFFTFPEDALAHWEGTSLSGYMNPRSFVEAQVTCALQQGGKVHRDIVCEVKEEGELLAVQTLGGERFYARKVLLAGGAFSNCFSVLERKLDIWGKTESVILAELPEDECKRLRNMPATVYDIITPELNDPYILPPIPYPDGKTYLKMGCNIPDDYPMHTLEELRQWFKCDDASNSFELMKELLLSVFPGLRVDAWHMKRCVVTYTHHRKPYIDTLVPGKMFVAVGGNGRSAACADAIGEIAAKLCYHDTWQDPLDAEIFQVHYKVDV